MMSRWWRKKYGDGEKGKEMMNDDRKEKWQETERERERERERDEEQEGEK